MRTLLLLFCVEIVYGFIWKNGIIHYTINHKDYDIHSQDVIMSTLSQIMEEICVKFFQSPFNNSSLNNDKILYFNNPDKRKNCATNSYDFSKEVVDVTIGYKCINSRDITTAIVEMLRASIDPKGKYGVKVKFNVQVSNSKKVFTTLLKVNLSNMFYLLQGSQTNSYDLVKKFKEKDSFNSMISESDRNYINAHYKSECGSSYKPMLLQRRVNSPELLSPGNIKYYNDKLWPLGIVLYGIEDDVGNSLDYQILKHAMTTIELATCVIFQEVKSDGVLEPKSQIWFGKEGNEMPLFGFAERKQNLKLSSFVNGAAGHSAHVFNNLLRILGMHMMSNRYDRDNYVTINWRNVEKGKEQYLERAPEEAWLLTQIPYDFDSITHAPANYMCSNCNLGATTVQPIQDYLWQRTIAMGHGKELSKSDVNFVNILYNKQCRKRYFDV